MKQSITEYLDYRDYLVDFYKEKRADSSYFTYRFIASKVGVDASHIAKIFSKKRHVPDKSVSTFIDLCKFNKRDAECFRLLIKFNKAKTEKESKQWYECILALKDVTAVTVDKAQYEFFNKWYYIAVLVLLEFHEFDGDYKWLAHKVTPQITENEAKQAIELLVELDLIKKYQNGNYRPTNKNITTGDTIRQVAIKNHQQETMKMASESLFRHKLQDRNISTVTLAIDHKDLPAIDEIIDQFRQTLMRHSEETTKPDSVYQLNVQLFPMTNKE